MIYFILKYYVLSPLLTLTSKWDIGKYPYPHQYLSKQMMLFTLISEYTKLFFYQPFIKSRKKLGQQKSLMN